MVIYVDQNRNGSYVISDGSNKEVYYGYSKTEAVRKFRAKFGKRKMDIEKKLKNIRISPKNKGDARQIAVDFQSWSSEQNLSYGELFKYQTYFRIIGEKFGLTEEFKENGII